MLKIALEDSTGMLPCVSLWLSERQQWSLRYDAPLQWNEDRDESTRLELVWWSSGDRGFSQGTALEKAT